MNDKDERIRRCLMKILKKATYWFLLTDGSLVSYSYDDLHARQTTLEEYMENE